MVLQLPNLSNIPLAIWSLQSSGVLVRARSGMWPCSLELLSCVEAAMRFIGSGAFFSPACV